MYIGFVCFYRLIIRTRLPQGRSGSDYIALVPVVGARMKIGRLAASNFASCGKTAGKGKAGLQFAGLSCEPPIPKKKPPARGGFSFGAGGGTRTHTVSLPTDFESVTSAIPSHRRVIDWVNIYIITGRREKSKGNLQPAAVLRSEELRVSCGS